MVDEIEQPELGLDPDEAEVSDGAGEDPDDDESDDIDDEEDDE